MEKLKVYDTVNKNTVELDEQGLIDRLTFFLRGKRLILMAI